MSTNILIIGAGNMGSAIYRTLSTQEEYEVHAFDTSKEKLEQLGCAVDFDLLHVHLKQADLVIIAVKPQSFIALAKELQEQLQGKNLISIMAGITIDTIQEATGAASIIRSMPNLALSVGHSITAWCAVPDVHANQKKKVQRLFEHFGYAFEVMEEEKLDDVTALSGSGPAYFFHIAALLHTQAEAYGFSKEEALHIACETLIGSAHILQSSTESPTTWRDRVTSKGGTTEAALHSLEDNNFARIFSQAIGAAKRRAKDLHQ